MTDNAPKTFTARQQTLTSDFDAHWRGCWAVSGDFPGGRGIMPLIPRAVAQEAAYKLNRCETYEQQREMMAEIRSDIRARFGEVRCFAEYPRSIRTARFTAPTA